MKNTKVVLTVVGLLLLGFLGGFFTHRQMTVQQVQSVREMTQPYGFQRHLLEYLEPTAEQREQLTPIIEEYAHKLGDHIKRHHQERRALVEAMHQQIKPLLTAEQSEKLEHFSNRFRERRERRQRPLDRPQQR